LGIALIFGELVKHVGIEKWFLATTKPMDQNLAVIMERS